MTNLPVASPNALRWSIDGWTPEAAQTALRGLEREAWGAGSPPLFADHAAVGDGPTWSVAGGLAYGFYELDETSRENLKARLARRVGQLRRTLDRRARAGAADSPRLAGLVRQALEVPGWGSLYAVAGEPVLAGWGHIDGARARPLGLLAGLDDGIALPAIVRSPWVAWVSGATVLVLLFFAGLAAAAWAPLGWLPVDIATPQCKIDSAALGLLDRYNDERQAIDRLERQLADLRLDRDRKQLACPIRTVDLPAPPPLPPEKKPDLPADKWANKDLSILEGCWVLGRDGQTNMSTDKGSIMGIVRAGKICFDKSGRGTREQVQEFPGYPRMVCRANVTAKFAPDGTVNTMQNPVPCEPRSTGTTWNGQPNNLTCTRQDDNTAICRSENGFTYEFRRSGR